MSHALRSRRAGMPAEEAPHRPLYARALRLRYVNPSGLLCFLFVEGAVALAVLLALAELVSWWGVVALPASVAIMVKVDDLVAGAVARSATPIPAGVRAEAGRGGREERAVGRASVRTAIVPIEPPGSVALAINVHPTEGVGQRVGRHRTDHGEAPDSPGQRARQSGTPRYQ
jgi:hypothetical protein